MNNLPFERDEYLARCLRYLTNQDWLVSLSHNYTGPCTGIILAILTNSEGAELARWEGDKMRDGIIFFAEQMWIKENPRPTNDLRPIGDIPV